MRIGLDVSKALTPRDGIGRYTRELLQALLDLEQTSAPEHVLELYGFTADDNFDRIRDELSLSPRHRMHRGWPQPDHQLDVFHATTWTVPPHPLGADNSARLLFTCYDLTFLSHPEHHTLDNKIHCLTGLLRANLRDAAFVAISQSTSHALQHHLGIAPERIQLIYPAASPAIAPLPRDEARHRLRQQFGIEDPPIVTVGTLEPRKNLSRLLDAYGGLDASLRMAHPLLVVGGGGWKNQAILERCRELATVHLLGQLEDEELSVLYSAAEVFAYPSLAEGFGLPVVEAMRCGAPVLTSNVSSLPEIAGDAALLIDPTNTVALREGLRELLENDDRRQRLRDLGPACAATFSWAETARQTLDLYRRLIADAPSAAAGPVDSAESAEGAV